MARRAGGFVTWLSVIAAGGLVLRLVYVFAFVDQNLPYGGDSIYYWGGANLFADGRGFIEPVSSLIQVQQSASHPPLYLLYLSLASLLWDHHATQLVHVVWTCVLGTGSIVVIGLAGREIIGERVGLIAAALAAVYPNMWVHDGALLSESMAIFTVALLILFAYRFANRPSMARLLWLGFGCGLASLARSELVLTVPLLLVPLVLVTKDVDWRKKVGWIATGAVIAVLVVSPWVTYNMTRFNVPVTLSTNTGGTMAAANCHSTYYGNVIGYKDYSCAAATFKAAERREPKWDTFDFAQKDNAVRAESVRYIKDHLSRLPVVVAARGRIVHLYEPFQEVQFDHFLLHQDPWVGYAIVWSFWLFAGFAIGGFVVMRRRHVRVWPLLVLPAIVLISVAATFAQTRYRAPAEVSIVLLAAVALDAIIRARSTRRSPDSAPDPA